MKGRKKARKLARKEAAWKPRTTRAASIPALNRGTSIAKHIQSYGTEEQTLCFVYKIPPSASWR